MEVWVLQPAIEILEAHRMMAISTVRPDGWPQTTIVGYANLGWTVYFAIFRLSQKFTNIAHDDRVSIAVGSEAHSLGEIKAVYAGMGERISAARNTVGRPLTLTEKILYAHLYDGNATQAYERGKSYVG